ncbi:MAG: 50S ribosomal protein L24 [Candidatus Nealsonbacteria bacterium]|nr:50S ribosomal protein L24 [Candidatus Nealsonbacteria bacterium]
MKIKKGDTVLIILGKDRGRKGKVLKIIPEKESLIVEGINIKKKHIRPKKGGEKGRIVQIAAPIHISNAKLICSKCGKPSRIGYKIIEKKKNRICKKCGRET